MILQPVHESLNLLRECRAVFLDHTEGLIYIFLDMRVWIACSDDTLQSGRQRIRFLPQRCCKSSPYLRHAQHPDEQIQTGNGYENYPAVQPVR